MVDATATGSEQLITFTELASQTTFIINCVQSVGSPAATNANNALSHQSLGDSVEGTTTKLECDNGKISNDEATCACEVGFTGGGFFLAEEGQWLGDDGTLREGCVPVECDNGAIANDLGSCDCDVGYTGGGDFDVGSSTYPSCTEVACDNGAVTIENGGANCACSIGFDGGGVSRILCVGYPNSNRRGL